MSPTLSADELKPCPFCGSSIVSEQSNDTSRFYWHSCGKCGCETEGCEGQSEARALWNRRAPDQAAELNAELVGALELYDAYVAVPQDRGGPAGAKGSALTAFINAKNLALSKAKGSAGHD